MISENRIKLFHAFLIRETGGEEIGFSKISHLFDDKVCKPSLFFGGEKMVAALQEYQDRYFKFTPIPEYVDDYGRKHPKDYQIKPISLDFSVKTFPGSKRMALRNKLPNTLEDFDRMDISSLSRDLDVEERTCLIGILECLDMLLPPVQTFTKWVGNETREELSAINIYGIYDDSDRTALGTVRPLLKNAQKERGGAIGDVAIDVSWDQPYCVCGEFAICRRDPGGKATLYARAKRPIQIRCWNEFSESESYGGAAEDFFRENEGGKLTPKFKTISKDIIISAGGRFYSGFTYDFKNECVVIGRVQRDKFVDRSAFALRKYFYIFNREEVGYGGERFVVVSPFVGTDLFLANGAVWEPVQTNGIRIPPIPPLVPPEEKISTQAGEGGGAVDESGQDESDASAWECSKEEYDFLESLVEYVGNCGFTYDPRDLVRFHTSVKSGMFTVLCGEPGCGKSSLVELYARVLAGRGFADGGRLLRVDVNPAWAEPADLLGYKNPLNRDEFLPAENGLYRYLRMAMKRKQQVFPVCLEEMNLACVEHYFSDFIQVITRDERIIMGYHSKDEEELEVSDNVRFVGTCNEDETGRRLSPRFLDRCNLIKLSITEARAGFDARETRFGLLEKPEVTSAVFGEWCNDEKIAVNMDSAIDKYFIELREALEDMGVALSPRTIKLITRYVRSRPNVENVKSETARQMLAFDEAFVQRVVPKCRMSPKTVRNCPVVIDLLSRGLNEVAVDGDACTMGLSVQALTEKLDDYKESLNWNV